MMKCYNLTDRTLFLFVFICMVGILTHSGCKNRRMSEEEAIRAFRGYVYGSIPESVTNIRADKPKKIQGYRYTFRFNINREDLGILINSRPFMRVWNVKYKNGDLSWTWDLGDGNYGFPKYNSSMICYNYTREPVWFRPGLWDNPEAYAFSKEGDLVNIKTFGKHSSGPVEIRVLLYNENEAEAYYVVEFFEN